MKNTNELKRKKAKDPFFQVSESFFEKEEILDLMSRYGYQGIGIYLKISIMLLKNQGDMNFNWKYISLKKNEKKIIEDIITESGLFTLNNDGTSFSSYIVTEQLEERGKISMDQTKRVNKRWEKNKNIKPEQKIDESIVNADIDVDLKPKRKKLTMAEIEELDILIGIKPEKDDLDLDA